MTKIKDQFSLNEDQEAAIELLRLFMWSNETFFLLSGCAGAGKTTVIQYFTEEIESISIAMTAPTNKAVKVLKSMDRATDHNVEYLTVYKLLDLTMGFESDEKVVVAREGSKSSLGQYDLVIIDESSQLSQKLFDLLLDAGERSGVKIVFIGDPAQLPPVKEGISPVFAAAANDEFQEYRLTKNRRLNGDSNPLAEKIDAIRDRVFTPELWKKEIVLTPSYNKDKTQGLFVLDPDQWLKTMVQGFSNDQWQKDPDSVRAIAWTNKTVNTINQYVRAEVYGNPDKPYVIGERLIANAPVFNPGTDEILISNCGEMNVLWSEHEEKDDHGFPVWRLGVATEDNVTLHLTALDYDVEGTERRFKAHLDDLATSAMNETTHYKKRLKWRQYWTMKDKVYANLSYAYALTAHKAQGSSFRNVFIAQKDILSNSNFEGKERYQCLYVAYSRARDRVFIC